MTNNAIAASIEVTPKHALDMADLGDLIPPSTRVYLTDVGTHNAADMAKACQRLINLGMIAVPHIAARRLTGIQDLEDRVKRYTGVGVYDTLVVGGSPTSVAGEVFSTMQVLETGLLDSHGITHIGIAGHPEGSPDFSQEVAEQALRLKKAFAMRTGAQMRIVTQFGFDARNFINWAEGLSQTGIDLPVYLGVAGPAKVLTLLNYAAMCGVGNSISFLKKHAGSVTALASSNTPESVVGPIETHMRQNPASAIRGVHIFPFGGMKKASQWLVDRGSWVDCAQYRIANRA